MTKLRLLRSTELLDIRVLDTASPMGVVEEYPVESICGSSGKTPGGAGANDPGTGIP